MQHRKLDMGRAWTQATGLIGGNRDTVGAIAGLFFFLPSFAAAVFVPELANPQQPAAVRAGGNPDSQAAMQAALDQIMAAYADNWLLFLVITIIQFVGSMSLLALLSDRGNPTVREALRTGIASIPTYIAAQLLSAIGAAIALGVPLGVIGAVAPPAVFVLTVLIAAVAMVYVVIKLVLTAPVIAIEGVRNPIAALRRSWRLTKGNSVRIVLFLFLLVITIGIIAALVSGILGLILSAIGEPVTTIGIDIVSALVNALVTVISLVVTVAIHRQLAGPSNETLAEAFE